MHLNLTKILFLSGLLTGMASCSHDVKSSSNGKQTSSVDTTNLAKTTIKEKAAKQSDSLGQVIDKFEFKVKAQKDELETFEDGYVPWISIDSPASKIKDLVAKDEIIIKESSVLVFIDYPLNKPAYFELLSKNGFSRKKLIEMISKKYHEIYDIEAKTSPIKPSPPETKKATRNRNETNGTYGIWGHDLIDLDLTGITVHKRSDGSIVLELDIDS